MSNLNLKWKRDNTFDAIVIGSGISGGWAAKELTEKGLRTLVLERGRMVRHATDYPTANADPWDLKYRDRVPREELDRDYAKQTRSLTRVTQSTQHWFVKESEHPYTEISPFCWVRGYQVGGRSLFWGRQCYRWSEMDFEANAQDGIAVDWPIRYRDLESWYAYVEKWAGISGQPLGLPQLPDSIFQPPMELNCLEQSARQKIESRFAERRLTIGRTAHLTRPTPVQLELGRGRCLSRNVCTRGCSYGAYFSSNATTLVAAQRTGNMTLRPNSIVVSILYDRERDRAIGVRILDAETGKELEFYSRIIFVNASTLNTAHILLNSGNERFPNGLGNSSDQLGRNVMDHHQLVGARGYSDNFGDRYYSGRRPNGIYIPRFRNIGASTRQKSFLRGYGYQGAASRQDWSQMVAEVGFGASMKERLRAPGRWQMGIVALGEMLPHPDNRVLVNGDLTDMYGLPTLAIDVKYRENEVNMRKDMRAAAIEMLEVAGLNEVQGFDRGFIPGNSIHEMGAARMGRDPKTSVLNEWNQLHDVKNVFVTDGACMTSSSCVNPSLTYMALTARAANFAVKELNRLNL